MQINGVEIVDTYAEAFGMKASRVIITAVNEEWALESARKATGFATSVIACGCEAGIERILSPSETPDNRPGVSILIFSPNKEMLEDQLMRRVGQTIMTCPSTACYNGLNDEVSIKVGGKLRFFGDGNQSSKRLEEGMYVNRFAEKTRTRLWRIPVMQGEFVVEESYGVSQGIGGGNFLILGENEEVTLQAAESAVKAMEGSEGVIFPFPGGIARSGSKTSSKYSFLFASTNTSFCPTLKHLDESRLPSSVNSVLEVILDGLDSESIKRAMKKGIEAACIPGIVRIDGGNYGGTLGKYLFKLHEILEGEKNE